MRKKRKNLINTSRTDGKRKAYLFLSFIAPFSIMFILFALYGVYPFRDEQILVIDLWHQYYPFLAELQDKLKTGGSLFYTWNSGLGSNYLSIMAYYAASPLNFLTVFLPRAYLREAMTLFLLVKIGCAGLFFAVFLKYRFRRNDITLPFFALLYALCSFITGYYWNVIWMDTAALLPLVALGIDALATKGRYRLFVVALFLSVFSNYYIGYMVCIFTGLYFFVVCAGAGVKGRLFWKRFMQIIFFSFIALGMTAALTLPAYYALQNTYGAGSSFPSAMKYYFSIPEIISNLITAAPPSTKEGLPNLFCGYVSVLLCVVYFRSGKISFGDKIANAALLIFIAASCNINTLDYIWHGFHFPNMLPARFSFMFSFVLASMAYRAFLLARYVKKGDIISMAVVSAVIAAFSAFYKEPWVVAVFSSMAAAYIICFYMYGRRFTRGKALRLIFMLMAAEMCASGLLGVDGNGTTKHDAYLAGYADGQTLMEGIKDTDKEFYRMEFTDSFTKNDPMLIGYRGISQFSSTANEHVSGLMKRLGISASKAGNRYYYALTSPFTNSLLNLKYVVSKEGDASAGAGLIKAGESGRAAAYRNAAYLPVGFMTSQDIMTLGRGASVPFEEQNVLFQKATGLSGDIFIQAAAAKFTHTNLSVRETGAGRYKYRAIDGEKESVLALSVVMTRDGALYVYADFPEVADGYLNAVTEDRTAAHKLDKLPFIFPAGEYMAGDTVILTCPIPAGGAGNATINVYTFDETLFFEGYSILSDEVLDVWHYSDTKLEGRITAKTDGLFYTSIPYEKGWSVTVDGAPREITPFEDAFIAFPLEAGEHEIAFSYVPEGFIPGAVISMLCLIIFAIFCARNHKAISF